MSLRRQIGALFLAATSFAGIANAQQKPVEMAQANSNALVGRPSMSGAGLGPAFSNSSVAPAPTPTSYVKSADAKAQDLSKAEKVVGIAVLIGPQKDPKGVTGEQIAQGLQKVLAKEGVPSQYFVEVNSEAGGALIGFYINGNPHLDSTLAPGEKPSSDFNMRGAFGEIPSLVGEFKDKFPEAVIKSVSEISHPVLTAEKR